MAKICGHCKSPLQGKQKRFCSDACRNLYWNNARRRGESPVQTNQGEAVQSLLDDLFRVLRDHSETISGLGKKDTD